MTSIQQKCATLGNSYCVLFLISLSSHRISIAIKVPNDMKLFEFVRSRWHITFDDMIYFFHR